ncbi:vitellogenin-2-like [Phlebotomus argentipes]|uniref:vitellogenin-2-like n=1 Tax=Phlebotomus argentipes TaxID=94469 RepID=UPI0028933F9F|nr:vitellogenin-2-like [Phlebotomus argentipes]
MTGWLTNLQEEKQKAAEVIYTAYKCRGYNNFLLFDPHVAIETLYSWSALNTHDLAEYITPAIIELTKNVDIKQLHLIGHSLGAHIAGNIGRIYKEETGKTLPRITGLDPARVCFNTGGGLRGLERGVADLVDVIHSNSGGLGAKDSIGDVDFFPNGAVVNMPGCSSLSCSHSRSWRYYAESVYPGNENGFLAKRCNLFLAYKQELCSGEDIIPMGYATPTNATGNYYLETNAESPYGFNSMTSVKCAN